MYEDLIENAGLTHNEAAVYVTLLAHPNAKSGEIVRAAKVSGGKIYETLYKLIEKGVVKASEENGVKHFTANDPSMLLTHLREKQHDLAEKEKTLSALLPQLRSLAQPTEQLETVNLIKGFRGVNSVVYAALERNKGVKVMGVRSRKDERFNNFWRQWHRERAAQKKQAKMLISDDKSDYSQFYEKLTHTSVRYSHGTSPSAVMVFEHECMIFAYEEDIKCIHIVSSAITKSFDTFFESMWTATQTKPTRRA